MTPEEKARQKIDAMLTASGWLVQTKGQIDLSASLSIEPEATPRSASAADWAKRINFSGSNWATSSKN
jgi:hypothetical protein